MSTSFERAESALRQLEYFTAGEARIQEQLADGPTSTTWLVEQHTPHQLYVLRHAKPLATELGLSPDALLAVTGAVAPTGLTAPVVAAMPEQGIILSPYLPGQSWSAMELQDHTQLSRLAGSLQTLHSVNHTGPELNYRQTVHQYAKRSNHPCASRWADEALAGLQKITPSPTVLCHNDLTAANIIDHGNALYFIDWEYAAMGDPLFEVAVIVDHHELDKTTAEFFLNAYLGQEDVDCLVDNLADNLADLWHWCAVYKNITALWQSLIDQG